MDRQIRQRINPLVFEKQISRKNSSMPSKVLVKVSVIKTSKKDRLILFFVLSTLEKNPCKTKFRAVNRFHCSFLIFALVLRHLQQPVQTLEIIYEYISISRTVQKTVKLLLYISFYSGFKQFFRGLTNPRTVIPDKNDRSRVWFFIASTYRF